MKERRVAVTGLGVVTALGAAKAAFWEALTAGRCAFSKVSSFDATGYRTDVGTEIKDFPPREAAAYAVAAATAALADAGLAPGGVEPSRAGVALGTTSGEILKLESVMERHRAGGALDDAFPFFPAGIAATLGRALGFRGPNVMLTTACSAGNAALACAFDKIRWGRADLMVAGGVDVFNRLNFSGFNRLLAVSSDVCAPFSKGRKGLIPGEGCGILILEDYESAAAAGRRIYAEMLGYGLSSDAAHVTMPDVEGIVRALELCLKHSGLQPGDVDYISAHGTGTPANDRLETAAVKRVFGERAARLPMSSIKSMLGHAMGAASALEAAACCLSLETGLLPPTMNFVTGDPDCGLDYVPNKARKTDPKIVVSNSFAFGGSNAVIALGKPSAPRRKPAPRPRARIVITGLGLVGEEDPLALAERLLPDKDLSYLDRPIAYALCAAKRALDDAGLGESSLGTKGGVILDSSGELGSLDGFYRELAEGGPSAVEPRLFPNILANAAASRVAIVFGLKLLNLSLAGSFPGGESALAAAFDALQHGGSGVILAGGVDDGAFMATVETLSSAQERRARVYAEVAGYEETFDPEASPSRGPGCFCLAKALQKFQSKYRGRGQWGGRIRFDFLRV